MDFDALRTQQAFASSLTAAAVGHNLAIIADQCSLLLLFFGWHCDHTQGFILTTQITIQAIAQHSYDYPYYGYNDYNDGEYYDGQYSPVEVTPSQETIFAVQKELAISVTIMVPSMA
jgi:hypothetical protein